MGLFFLSSPTSPLVLQKRLYKSGKVTTPVNWVRMWSATWSTKRNVERKAEHMRSKAHEVHCILESARHAVVLAGTRTALVTSRACMVGPGSAWCALDVHNTSGACHASSTPLFERVLIWSWVCTVHLGCTQRLGRTSRLESAPPSGMPIQASIALGARTPRRISWHVMCPSGKRAFFDVRFAVPRGVLLGLRL